jgi:3-oxoacyl-[acyl-carrier-protein] synthase II
LYYITASASISHQPTFQNPGFSENLQPLMDQSELQSPPYKDYIEGAMLRRMSKILRMSVASAIDCVRQADSSQLDAIVVGTGLGCLHETEKFLNNVLTIEGLLPPTAFIQSTHNTIAGQISLSLGNHGYNMTHTQNAFSFEYALQDALMLLQEDASAVLVGGADEAIDFLEEIRNKLSLPTAIPLTSGASFFIVSKVRSDQARAKIVDVAIEMNQVDLNVSVQSFLEIQGMNISEIDRIAYLAPVHLPAKDKLAWIDSLGLNPDRCIDLLALSGTYATVSAFGLHYAVDKIAQKNTINKVLILNHLNPNGLGLTLVESIEA